MAETIRITASVRIERAPEVVRAQFRDIDHHVRTEVHPGVRYQWEAGGSGQRRVRTTFRVLGTPQFDVAVHEDAPDGTLVVRYLEGANAGMLLTHRFAAAGEGATDVQVTADIPGTGSRKLLGPLFVAGARQALKKSLSESKRDIEGDRYKQETAAGAVENALAHLQVLAVGELE